MSDYIMAATVFANSDNDHRFLGFISKGRKNYSIYKTNQQEEHENPFDKEKFQIVYRTPSLFEAMEYLYKVATSYNLPFNMRIATDAYPDGFQCGLFILEHDAKGHIIDQYFERYARRIKNVRSHMYISDFRFPVLLGGEVNYDEGKF